MGFFEELESPSVKETKNLPSEKRDTIRTENVSSGTNKLWETSSRWYEFQFYENYFECQYKMNFRKRHETIYYKDIENITFSNISINFTRFYTYTIKLKNRKKIKLVANYEFQLLDLQYAMGFVQEFANKSKLADILKENSVYIDGKYYF